MPTNFAKTKSLFNLPEQIIYLDGNSLGPLPKAASTYVKNMMEKKWGKLLISGWNKDGWMDQPKKVGNRIAKLVGAENDHIIVGDTLSIKIYQALDSALKLNKNKKIILTDSGNFPSDIYIADGLIKSLNLGHELRIVEPEQIADSLTDEIAVLLLTEVDYRTGRKHDMNTLTSRAHELGILTVWDLAHSAGAINVQLENCNVDFAAGCTYKYLNGGPGSPAFLYVSPRHINTIEPILKGWMGHASPFNFEEKFIAARGIDRMRIGTPPVIATVSLEAALDIFDKTNMPDIHQKSIELTEVFINEIEKKCPMLKLASPRDANLRGSHVSYHFENGYAVIQALIERGVIGDFRAPDIIRFGFTPLFIDKDDVLKAVKILDGIMKNSCWDKPEFKKKQFVT